MDSKSTSDSFPGFEELYRLSDPLSNPPFRGDALTDQPAELLRAECSPAEPVRVAHAMGGRPFDLIWTTYAGLFLISSRVRDLLENEGITGWRTYPVEVTGRQGAVIPGYHGFAVTGRCGPFDLSKSQMIIKPPPVPRGRAAPYHRGLFFEPSTWDGSDVFCSENGWLTVIVTRKVHDLFRRYKVRNVEFERLIDYEKRALT